MKREFMEKWVAALRSGDYRQTRKKLFNGYGHCCLGIAERVSGNDFCRLESGQYAVDGTTESNILTARTLEQAEIYSQHAFLSDHSDIVVGGKSYFSLVHANDDGRTFAEIADAIEANWERL